MKALNIDMKVLKILTVHELSGLSLDMKVQRSISEEEEERKFSPPPQGGRFYD